NEKSPAHFADKVPALKLIAAIPAEDVKHMKRLFAPLILLGFAFPVDAAEPKLRAGAYAQDVTPTAFPVSVNGGMADRKATSAHDPLHARCLVLDDGKTRIALVVVD